MGKGVRAKWKLLLKMSAACKGRRNVHELFFLPCVRQGGKESFEQKLSLSRTVVLSANVHACGRQCNFPVIALQLIGRGSEQLLAATSVQVVLALLQTCWHTTHQLLQEAMLLAFLNLSVRRFCRRSQSEKKGSQKMKNRFSTTPAGIDIGAYSGRKNPFGRL